MGKICYDGGGTPIQYVDSESFIQYYDGGCIKLGRRIVEADANGDLVSIEYLDADGNTMVDLMLLNPKNYVAMEHFAGCAGSSTAAVSTADVATLVQVIQQDPDTFVAALATASNLINIDDLAGTTTHKAFPA